MSRSTVVKARSGLAFNIAAGERFRVIDVAGEQVSDLVAFVREDLTERFSQANTRKLNGALKLHKGDTLYSTRCRKRSSNLHLIRAEVHPYACGLACHSHLEYQSFKKSGRWGRHYPFS